MANKSLPTAVLWLVVAVDLVIAALALGLYAGLLPKFHPLLAQLPATAYLLAAVIFAAGAGVMVLTQRRSRDR